MILFFIYVHVNFEGGTGQAWISMLKEVCDRSRIERPRKLIITVHAHAKLNNIYTFT